MKLGRLLIAWGIVATAASGLGWWFPIHVLSAQDSSAVLKTASGVFAAAAVGLGFVFRLLDSPATKDLDDSRQEYWTRKFNFRWRMLWVRWTILLVATGAALLATSTLDSKFGLLSQRGALAMGTSAVIVGLLAVAKSIYETFHIRRTVQEVNQTILERKKRQALLDRLDEPVENKHVQV